MNSVCYQSNTENNRKARVGKKAFFMGKIIYIIEHPYGKRDHHRYGSEYLMQKGYCVEIWRVVNSKSVAFGRKDDLYDGKNLYEYTYAEFKNRIKMDMDALYIMLGNENPYYVLLSKQSCRCILMMGMGAVPTYIPKLGEEKNTSSGNKKKHTE